MSLAAGTRIGPYEIVSLLGVGGMGEVYRATDHALARDVAIKVLRGPWATDDDRLARFRREAQLLASLNHPNIGQISTMGGSRPAWARNGRELFYLDGTNQLMAVLVQTSPAFSAGNPTRVFETRYLTPNNGRTYDVSADGQRFLMIKGSDANERASGTPPVNIVVVLNWFEELKQRVPVK